MSKEKQVDDLANDIAMICPDLVESGCGNMNCITCLAQGIVQAKFSRAIGRNIYYGEGKWISVDEGFPEDMYGKGRKKITVLVCTESGKVSTASRQRIVKFNSTKLEWEELDTFEWSNRKRVTHWMPLPEAPKGGAE